MCIRDRLIDDERFSDYATRLRHRDLLTDILDSTLSANSTAYWLEVFGGQIPAAPVLSPKEALRNPFFKEREGAQKLKDSQNNSFNLLASCIETGADRSNDTAAPVLSQHTSDILRNIGYGQDEIDNLYKEKLI